MRQTLLIFYVFAHVWVVDSCGYDTCHATQPGMINVHLVSHSHDDVGWLKTVDQYFLGSNRRGWMWENQKVGVTDIFDSVMRSLMLNPDRKYIQVESAFFWRWWLEQDSPTRQMWTELVESGQLEFIGGGWSMNDEGAAHYVGIIDNMALGFKVLNTTFGECGVPKVAWQVDPFGHSREQANLFSLMGYDGYLFGRLDWRDKDKRMTNKELEMIWQTSDDAPNEIFTGINYNVYWPPDYFCWDFYCNDEPIMDNPILKDYNVEKRIDDFFDYILEQHSYYATDHILVTLGMDFHYQAAHTWFKNIDKLIKYANGRQANGSNINLFYSTPSCYLKSLNEAGSSWPTKLDDFFPYASDPHAYWTGYFSSRPTSKRMILESSQLLMAARQMSASLHAQDDDRFENVDDATVFVDKAAGVAQHHDAVTGTEKQHVANDYHQTLATAQMSFFNASLVGTGFEPCPLLNISQCPISESNDVFTVNVYNPLGQVQSRIIRVPIKSNQCQVNELTSGQAVPCQSVLIPQQVLNLPGQETEATHEAVFEAVDLPALGSSSFVVRTGTKNEKSTSIIRPFTRHVVNDLEIQVDPTTWQVSFKRQGLTLTHQFGYYTGYEGQNQNFDDRASGAYIFRPFETRPNLVNPVEQPTLVQGQVVDEIHQEINEFISVVTRIYKNQNDFDHELEWLVGPIPIDDDLGKEIIVRGVVEGMNNEGLFFTDANGRQMMTRERNLRPTFDINMTEPVSQNYYPVNSRISIRNQNNDSVLTVLNDRSQAGGSIEDGTLELLLHRRLLWDDDFGVNETLNETDWGEGLVARGKLYSLLDTDLEQNNMRHRLLGIKAFGAPIITLAPGEVIQPQIDLMNKLSVNLTTPLPPNVHLLTLMPWYLEETMAGTSKFYLMRLEHIFQKNEHSLWSQDATVNVENLLASLGQVVGLRETSLGANMFKDDLNPMTWSKNKKENTLMDWLWNSFSNPVVDPSVVQPEFEVTLAPMDIKTYVVEVGSLM